jgi:hypothetical protein
MAFTDAQRADVYFFAGWPQRYQNVNTALEWAMDKIVSQPAQEAILTNGLTASPPGLLAKLRQLHDTTIPGAYGRLRATKVGSIDLDARAEINYLRSEGRRLVNAMCSTLGIKRDADVFAPGDGTGAPPMWGTRDGGAGSGGFIGK